MEHNVAGAELTVIQESVLRQIPRLNLPAQVRVLDAPCGASAALTLALKAKGFAAIGADLDEGAASALGEAFARVNLNSPLPWADETFGSDLDRRDRAFGESFRVLPGILASAAAKRLVDCDNA